MRELPFAIDDTKCDVLVRRSGTEEQQHSLVIARLFDDFVGRCLGFVDKIRIEDVELRKINEFEKYSKDTVKQNELCTLVQLSEGDYRCWGRRNIRLCIKSVKDEHTRNAFDCIYSTRTRYEHG